MHNTSVYLDARGEIRGIYRKIHLFDVAIPDGATYRESASVKPRRRGRSSSTATLGKVGLTICYDLRFPELYRALVARGRAHPDGAGGLHAAHGARPLAPAA